MNSDDTRWNTAVRVEAIKIVTVTVANGDRLTADSIGSASFSGMQGAVTFTVVLYVPGLHKNLISDPKLIEKGSSLTMFKNKFLVESKRGLVMEIKKSGSFYITESLTVVTATARNPPFRWTYSNRV